MTDKFLKYVLISPCLSFFRVHPKVCHGGGSKGAGGGRGRLLLRELHVRLFGGRGSGHGVVVKGGRPRPPSPHNRLLFPKEQKLSTIFIFKQDNFLQRHKDFYCDTRICSMILQNINSYLGSHDHLPFAPESLFRSERSASFISMISSGETSAGGRRTVVQTKLFTFLVPQATTHHLFSCNMRSCHQFFPR